MPFTRAHGHVIRASEASEEARGGAKGAPNTGGGGYKPHILHTCIYGTSRHGTPPPRDPPAGVGLGLGTPLFWGGEIQKKEELE